MIRLNTVAAMLVAVAMVSDAVAGARIGSLDVDLQRYRADTGAGTVTIRAYQEHKRSDGPGSALTDVTVIMLPRSAALLDRLTKIKDSARDSLARYRAAATEMRRAQDDFVKAVSAADGETLVRQGAVDDDGKIILADVPAGEWIMLARRAAFIEKPSGTTTQRERRIYTLSKPMEGFRDVTVWMKDLNLRPGSSESIELTDRNVWFRGVEEVRRTGPGR